ncbi:hypothetical protein [Blastococcus sp. SYSU DS0617]
MRLRSLVLPAVLAVGAAVVAPTPAHAAAQCGLIVPSKVVVDAEEVEADMRLTLGCYRNEASYAYWDYRHKSSGTSAAVQFTPEELAEGEDVVFVGTWPDDAPMGRWQLKATGAARADLTRLVQNDAYTTVKYGSKLATSVSRTRTKLTWVATATQWSGRSHKDVARAGVRVGVFHQPTSRSAWTFVKSVRTSRAGTATVSVASPKAGNYRLVVAETPTVWAAYSRTIKGRL